MTTFSDLASVPSDPLVPFTDQLRLAVAAYPARFRAPPASTPNPTRAATSPGAPGTPWTRSPRSAAPGAVHPVDAGDPPVQALHRVPAVSVAAGSPHLRPRRHLAALTRRACPPPRSPRRITDARIRTAPAVRGPAHRRPGVGEPVRFRACSHAWPAGLADLRSHQRDIADLGEEHGHR